MKRIERTGIDLEHHIQGALLRELRKLPTTKARRRVASWLAEAAEDDSVAAPPADPRQADLFGGEEAEK